MDRFVMTAKSYEANELQRTENLVRAPLPRKKNAAEKATSDQSCDAILLSNKENKMWIFSAFGFSPSNASATFVCASRHIKFSLTKKHLLQF
jgi:hypothetical protein